MKKYLGFIFLVLITSELLCRFFVPEYRRDAMTVDARGNRINRPNYYGKSYTEKTEKGYSWIITNSKGQRVVSNQNLKSKDNKFLIYWYGDSLSFGLHLNYENTFVNLLEKKLSTKDVKIINCSVVSSNISELYELFKHQCPPEKADLIVVQPTIYNSYGTFALFSGEVMGGDGQLAMFLYQCVPDFLKAKIVINRDTKLIDFDGNRSKYASIYKSYYGAWLPLYDYSHLIRKFEHNYVAFYKFNCRHQIFPFLFDNKFFEIFKKFINHFGLSAEEIPNNFVAIDMLKSWKEEVEAKGSQFLVLNLPNAEGLSLSTGRINNSDRQLVSNRFPKAETLRLKKYKQIYDQYLVALENNDINSLDYLNRLEEYEISELFLHDDNHFNLNGHIVLSDLLFEDFTQFLSNGQ